MKRMRRGWLVFWIGILILVPVRAGEENLDPKVIIERAVRSYGGKDNIREIGDCRVTCQGTVFLGKDAVQTFESETWQVGSDKYKLELRMTIHGRKRVLIRAIDGQTGWQKFNDDVSDITGDELKDFRASLDYLNAANLYSLLENPQFRLTRLKDEKIGRRASFAVKVSAKGTYDVTLFFDCESALITKISRTGTVGSHRGKLIEEHFEDYKSFANTKYSYTRITYLDGKKHMATEVKGIEILKGVDAKLFAKPMRSNP